MAELLIVLVISLFVIVVWCKIKSNYDEKAYRRDVNRRYKMKRDNVEIIFRKRSKHA